MNATYYLGKKPLKFILQVVKKVNSEKPQIAQMCANFEDLRGK